jgi:hypothetical protein
MSSVPLGVLIEAAETMSAAARVLCISSDPTHHALADRLADAGGTLRGHLVGERIEIERPK